MKRSKNLIRFYLGMIFAIIAMIPILLAIYISGHQIDVNYNCLSTPDEDFYE